MNPDGFWPLEGTNLCAGCDGWGFVIELENPWQEAWDSPVDCEYCGGLGYIETGGKKG